MYGYGYERLETHTPFENRRHGSSYKPLPILIITALVFLGVIFLGIYISQSDSTKAPTTLQQITKIIKLKTGTPNISTTPQPVTICSSDQCQIASDILHAHVDLEADPCTDFYQYTCGGFKKKSFIPKGLDKFSSFTVISNKIKSSIRMLMEMEPSESESETIQKAKTFYRSCLDVNLTNDGSRQALQGIIVDMGGLFLAGDMDLPTIWSLVDLMKQRIPYSMEGLFSFSVETDQKNSSRNTIEICQGGLGLGGNTRSYYVGKNVDSDPNLKAYTEYLTFVAKYVTEDINIDVSLVREIVIFEQKLAEIMVSESEMRLFTKRYSRHSVDWLQANSPLLQWTKIFSDIFSFSDEPTEITKDDDIVILGPEYFVKLSELISDYIGSESGRITLQNYFVMMSLIQYSPYLGGELEESYFKLKSVVAGTSGTSERWDQCVRITSKAMKDAVSSMYLMEHLEESEDIRSNISQYAEDIKLRMLLSIQSIDWIDEDTRLKSVQKLDAMNMQIGYPDYLTDASYIESKYQDFDVSSNHAQNLITSYRNKLTESLKSLREIPDRNKWVEPILAANAFYLLSKNHIEVLIGLSSPPLYYPGKDEALKPLNYGAIGMTIGHEITHGFDDVGSKFDENGNVKEWWSAESRKAFEQKAQCIYKQYTDYGLNGNLTLAENIADNGGLRLSYKAFKSSVGNGSLSPLIGLESLTPDQLFFVAYGVSWCTIYTQASLKSMLKTNVHSPAQFRVMGAVSNIPEFAQAFQCKPEDAMNPEQRCRVW